MGKTQTFQTTENMVEWLSPELYLKVNALFAAGIKLFPKTKRETMQETIKRKYSNAGKIQNFTFWALAKIHPYCLRILKSTGNHICLKFWKFRFDLRKKKKKFCKSDNRKGYLAILNLKRSTCSIWESFQRTVLQGKNGSPGNNRYRKHGWGAIRTDEGAGSTVGTGVKNFSVAAQEKHVSKGFDRGG